MADQGKNDQKFIFAIAMRAAQAGGWPAASLGEGDGVQAPGVRQEREERCEELSHIIASAQATWLGPWRCPLLDD